MVCSKYVVFDVKGVTCISLLFCFFQAEDGIRDLVRSRGLGDVYKRQSICANCFSRAAVG